MDICRFVRHKVITHYIRYRLYGSTTLFSYARAAYIPNYYFGSWRLRSPVELEEVEELLEERVAEPGVGSLLLRFFLWFHVLAGGVGDRPDLVEVLRDCELYWIIFLGCSSACWGWASYCSCI